MQYTNNRQQPVFNWTTASLVTRRGMAGTHTSYLELSSSLNALLPADR